MFDHLPYAGTENVFFVQSAKKNSAENIKQKSCSRKQQKSIPKKAYSNKVFTMIAEKRTAEKQTAEKHFPEKLIFWITSPWQVCFKKVESVSEKPTPGKRRGFKNARKVL